MQKLFLLIPVALLAGVGMALVTGDAFYLLWAFMLLAQNAAFTMVSRARNSGSDWYHSIAAVGSNGVWLVATFFTFDKVFFTATMQGLSWEVAGASALYVVCTVIGSVTMGRFLRLFIERGNRQVGHYDEKAARIDQLEQDVRSLARVVNDHLNSERQRAAKERLRERLASLHESVGEEMEGEHESSDAGAS